MRFQWRKSYRQAWRIFKCFKFKDIWLQSWSPCHGWPAWDIWSSITYRFRFSKPFSIRKSTSSSLLSPRSSIWPSWISIRLLVVCQLFLPPNHNSCFSLLLQFDEFNINDFQWLRQCYDSLSIPATSKPVCCKLEKFSLHSKQPLIVVDQFRLLNFVLSTSHLLTGFSLSCTAFDSNSKHHYNLNQTILVLLQKYGAHLEQLKLENILSNDSYLYLAFVILTCPKLNEFAIESCNQKCFLDCIELQLDHLTASGMCGTCVTIF